MDHVTRTVCSAADTADNLPVINDLMNADATAVWMDGSSFFKKYFIQSSCLIHWVFGTKVKCRQYRCEESYCRADPVRNGG